MELKVGEVQIIGLKKNVKDEKVSYNIFGITPFDDFESSGTGLKTFQEWTVTDLSGLKTGNVIIPLYGKSSSGKAYLKGYRIVGDK